MVLLKKNNMRSLLIFFLLSTSLTFSQHSKDEVLKYQDDLKEFYVNPDTTPLKTEELNEFIGINFFPFSEDYIVKAKIEYVKNEPVFKMASTGKRQQDYRRFAILHFELFGQKEQLEVYQNIALSEREGFEDSYFLPFLDFTNGEFTAEQGRYIDLKIPKNATEITLNFNLAYHPYCAYSHGYSCPITPFVNLINQSVDAGVKY